MKMKALEVFNFKKGFEGLTTTQKIIGILYFPIICLMWCGMNYRKKRFIETTIPIVIGYGLIVLVTTLLDVRYGLMAILIFAVIDPVMSRDKKKQK